MVDDEELVRGALQKMVELHGIPAVLARSGVEAIEKARQESFRMVFLDLSMPGMNGVETLKALKKMNRELVFVIVTALTGEDELFRNVLEHAPVSVIPKPFTVQQIRDVLAMYFEGITRLASSSTKA
ncbi:MAG: hypothetical protein DMG06_26260 [Acidobacteria bacterium]|nr:MAG: hypothetical protein DMG06_26260 [Acidobacteriota bacterium]